MKREIFILLPAPVPAGPVKGAYALANALAGSRNVTLVTLRAGGGAEAPLDSRVRAVSLAEHRSMSRKREAYRELLERAGGRGAAASISMCFSADWVSMACRRSAVTCVSIRGNLVRNYCGDYGLPGVPLAIIHLASVCQADHVVAMTHIMARQIARYSRHRAQVIGNFVDEDALESWRTTGRNTGRPRCVFLGSLSARKQPLLAVQAVAELRRRGIDLELDIIGDGPMRSAVQREIERLQLGDIVRLRGFLPNPHALLGTADVLLLPSLSEGISRACLEALHLGVRCVLRAVDGNSELIASGRNGELFETDRELPDALSRVLALARQGTAARASLLPPAFRQHTAAQAYLDLVESPP